MDEESSDDGDVCGVEWECELNGTGDQDILGKGLESTAQSKWELSHQQASAVM